MLPDDELNEFGLSLVKFFQALTEDLCHCKACEHLYQCIADYGMPDKWPFPIRRNMADAIDSEWPW